MVADSRAEGSVVYPKRGLRYSITGLIGEIQGMEIKASAIFGRLIVEHLEKQFWENMLQKSTNKAKFKKGKYVFLHVTVPDSNIHKLADERWFWGLLKHYDDKAYMQ